MYDRQSCQNMTAKGLKMNRFEDGKFMVQENSFWPKKSYNKILNMNLIKSNKFLNDIGIFHNSKNEIEKTADINQFVYKSTNFYSNYSYLTLLDRNFEDLIKENLISKFDNVTLKTIDRKTKLDEKELNRFLLNSES